MLPCKWRKRLGGKSGIRLNVQASTLADTISAISPISITAIVSMSMVFEGTVAARLGEVGPRCTSATPSVDPTDGCDATSDYLVSALGTDKLCYRASGGSDSVEQSGISLNVQAGALAETISAISPHYSHCCDVNCVNGDSCSRGLGGVGPTLHIGHVFGGP